MKLLPTRFWVLALGCFAAAPHASAQTGQDLVIGVIAPTGGGSSYFGTVIHNGVLIAVDEANATRFRSAPIRTRLLSDDSDAEAAAAAVHILHSAGALAIIGPMDSHCAAAAAREADALGIPLVSPSATASYLTIPPHPWFFRAINSDGQRARDLARWVQDLYPNGSLLIVAERRTDRAQDPLYGESIADDVAAALSEAHYAFVRVDYDRAHPTLDVAALRSQAAIAIFGRSSDTRTLALAVRAHTPEMPVFLISPGKEMFGAAPLDSNIYAVTDTVIESTAHSALQRFRNQYVTRYGTPPGHPIDQYATFGYDAATVVIEAIQRARADASWGELDIATRRSVLRREIASTPPDRIGLMSTGGFSAHGELTFHSDRQVLTHGRWSSLERALRDAGEQGIEPMNLSITLFLMLAAAIAALLWQLPRIRAYESSVVTFVAFALVALLAAAVTFSFSGSIASVSGTHLGLHVRLGGAAGLFFIVLLVGLSFEHRARRHAHLPFTVTFTVFELGTGQARSVTARPGAVTLHLPGSARSEPVVEGTCRVDAIDRTFANQTVPVSVRLDAVDLRASPPTIRLVADQHYEIAVRTDRTKHDNDDAGARISA